ncbi:MAG: hypothetical protein H0V61_01220 [Chitinophagales bacterium]|nr:hypothetical protein [Chitinophagales bacterium]
MPEFIYKALIDTYLPRYHFKEFHKTEIKIPLINLFEKMVHSDLSRSSLIKFLFWIRGMPTKIYTVESLSDLGFVKLGEIPGEEILFGRITESAMFNNCHTNFSSSDFIQKSDPTIIKAVINFRTQNKCHLHNIISTETRVWCGSADMKSKFRIYWFVVKPFSQMIRKLMLSQIKKQILNASIKNQH